MFIFLTTQQINANITNVNRIYYVNKFKSLELKSNTNESLLNGISYSSDHLKFLFYKYFYPKS